MNFTYFGADEAIFWSAFFGPQNGANNVVSDTTANGARLTNPDTGAVTLFSGTNLTYGAGGLPTGGVLTGMTFQQDGVTVATVSNISWNAVTFFTAVVALGNDTTGPMAALFNLQPITFDATGADQRIDMDEIEEFQNLITQSLTLRGSPFGDDLSGGAGNDLILPGSNSQDSRFNDYIEGTFGNDTIDFAGATAGSFYQLDYNIVSGSGGLTVTIDGTSGTGTVAGAGFTDTLRNVDAALQADGLMIYSTIGNDSFILDPGVGGWFNIVSGEGADSYTLTLSGDGRLTLSEGIDGPADQAAQVNLATGVIANDGFGNTEQLTITGGNGFLEVRGTGFADTLLGSARDEGFDPWGGNDTINGADGNDRVRYSWNNYGPMTVDLGAGTATGSFEGQSFTNSLISIEVVLGSVFDDDITGHSLQDTLDGFNGADTLDGAGGDDDLYGGAGDDSLTGGTGQDYLDGGIGDDLLDGSEGSRMTEGTGDFIRPGLGQDTILGNADLWASGNGIDVTYTELFGMGGLTITQGANGSGTVVSGTPGAVNDIYTFGHLIQGSQDGDRFVGATTDSGGVSVWMGNVGDDTIEGGAGFDVINFDEGNIGQGITVTLTAFGTGTAVDGFGFTDQFSGIEFVYASQLDDTLTGSADGERLFGVDGNDRVSGLGGNDTLEGGLGSDTLIGGDGDDVLSGASYDDPATVLDDDIIPVAALALDLRDLIYGGDGNDLIDGGYGNDELRGDAGNDTIAGGFGADTVIGGAGNDVLTGSAFGDLLFGGDGNDFINGGFGFDRVNGGAGADRFFHIGLADHGSDWIQDYSAADGDVLVWGGGAAQASDFLVQRANTPAAGSDTVQEVFITHIPTQLLVWALVDGDAQGSLTVAAAGQSFDLLG